MNFSFQLLFEAIHKASVVPFGSDITFYVMRAFGTFDMAVPVILTVIGASLGHVVNWYAGRTLAYFEYKGKFRINPNRYERARALFDKYGMVFWILCWLPFFNLLVVLGGFFKLPLKKVMPFVLVGLAVHYGLALR